jgi:phosphatidate cytidylyltransferase
MTTAVKRVLTAVVLLPAVVFVVWLGGVWLYLLLGMASLLAMREFYQAMDGRFCKRHMLGYTAALAYFVLMYTVGALWAVATVLVGLMIYSQLWLIIFYGKVNYKEVATAVYGFLYIPFLLGFGLMVRDGDYGIFYIWLIFLAAMGCDTFAYIVGANFGKRKLNRGPSPSKTWEGIIGGVVGAGLVGIAVGFAVPAIFPGAPDNFVWLAPTATFIGAIAAVFGDLSASAVKRSAGVKDFGSIFPGHGGIMDRIDSILLVAPHVYAIVWLLS